MKNKPPMVPNTNHFTTISRTNAGQKLIGTPLSRTTRIPTI